MYGICGIGNGHLYRQLPIIESLLKDNHYIMFFCYGNSLAYIKKHYAMHPNVNMVEVNVPYYIGNAEGLDFVKTEQINRIDFDINLKAFAETQLWLGKPDLVISDYEPFSAQYGYAYNCKVITIDQQSKYFVEDYPDQLAGTGYNDEVMRLRMFFPLAQRIACSFFKVDSSPEVEIVPPILRTDILKTINIPQLNEYLVYISAQTGFNQSLEDIIDILSARTENFFIFVPNNINTDMKYKNIAMYKHGDSLFEQKLKTCAGIITTAGHSLISESMHLGIPVYAMPMKLYEQQLNAYMVSNNMFGVQNELVNSDTLEEFISNNSLYRTNIQNSSKLFRTDGLEIIMNRVNIALQN